MQVIKFNDSVVDTNWTVLNKKTSSKIPIKFRKYFDIKWIYVPSITVELEEIAVVNHLKPIASLNDDLESLALHPEMCTGKSLIATLGTISVSGGDAIHYGTVHLVKEDNSYHIIYYINTPVKLTPGIYTISDTYINYI